MGEGETRTLANFETSTTDPIVGPRARSIDRVLGQSGHLAPRGHGIHPAVGGGTNSFSTYLLASDGICQECAGNCVPHKRMSEKCVCYNMMTNSEARIARVLNLLARGVLGALGSAMTECTPKKLIFFCFLRHASSHLFVCFSHCTFVMASWESLL